MNDRVPVAQTSRLSESVCDGGDSPAFRSEGEQRQPSGPSHFVTVNGVMVSMNSCAPVLGRGDIAKSTCSCAASTMGDTMARVEAQWGRQIEYMLNRGLATSGRSSGPKRATHDLSQVRGSCSVVGRAPGTVSASSPHRSYRAAEPPPERQVWETDDSPPTGPTLCDGWDVGGPAAPLIDPWPQDCTLSDLRWWLQTTSVAHFRHPSGSYRMYFFDGRLRSFREPTLQWPLTAERDLAGVIASYPKFSTAGGTPITDRDQLDAWWYSTLASANGVVTGLHFAPDFISFLDSEDGIFFPINAPWMITKVSGASNPCQAANTTPRFTYNGERAGWRSTAIPCANASVVYKVDSVLRVTKVRYRGGQADVYLMFAVQCDGRGIGAYDSDNNHLADDDAIDHDRDGGDYADCSICSPGACLMGEIPRTRYVFFISRDADFQKEVWGPFDALRAAPDREVGDWIGVPQAFSDPEERFLFFYVHPQPGSRYSGAGLRCAPMDAVRDALATILANRTLNVTGPTGLPALTRALQLQQRWGGGVFSAAFVSLGELLLCIRPLETSLTPDFRVDEHFVFCEGRLHLFFTYRDPLSPVGELGTPRLRAIWHASAWEPFDAKRLERALAEEIEAAVPELFLGHEVLDMTNRFTVTTCEPLDIVRLVGAEETEFQDNLGSVTVEVNDPTVELVNAPGMVMLFHSEALRALMVAYSQDGCSLRACEAGDLQVRGQPGQGDKVGVGSLNLPDEELFRRPEWARTDWTTWRDWTLPPRYA